MNGRSGIFGMLVRALCLLSRSRVTADVKVGVGDVFDRAAALAADYNGFRRYRISKTN